MMPHDDQAQDTDMIKDVLQKIIDEMNDMESQRMLPDGHPSKHVEIAAKVEPSDMDQQPTEQSDDSSDHNDADLSALLGKADSADSDGSLPEDHEEDLPPEISALIAEKRKQQLK